MNEDYNIDEEYDRYYMSNTIKKNLNESNQNDYSSYLKVYNEDTDQDDVLLNMGNNVFTTISSQPSEKKEIVSGENTFTVPANQSDIGSNVNQNTFNKYLSQNYNVVPGMSLNLDDKNIQAAGKNILGGVAKGVDMFTDMTSDFTSKYIEVTNPALANLIRTGFQQDEVNVKDAVSSFFPEVNLEVLNPETDAGKTAQDIISLFTATALAPGSALPKAVGGMGAVGPEFGNVFTIFKEFGLENDVVNFLSSKLENPEDATLDERLVSRLKSIVDVPAEAAALFSVAKTLSAKGAQILGLATAGTITSAEVAEAGPLGKIVSSVLKKKTIKKSDLAKDNIFDGIAEVKAPTDNEPGIIAFHGSGADFDRFGLDKIGTGEGSQAFGYGLYFTDSEDIAKFYRETLRQERNMLHLDGKMLDSVYTADNVEKFGDYVAKNFPSSIHDDVYMVLDNLGQGLGSIQDADNLASGTFRTATEKQIYNKIRKDLSLPELPEGKTYKVALAPKPDELLDYDKPLSEQPEMLKKLQNITEFKTYKSQFGNTDNLEKLTGKELYSFLEDNKAVPQKGKEVSKQLNDVGIKGIKYKAGQLSGIKDSKNTNFVIFDENLINILAKYGIVGSVGITALGSSEESL